MHYFIIHSGCDYGSVKELISIWSEEFPKLKCSVLKGTKSDWHDDARAKIRGAEKVIYIVGEKSGVSENIDWELGVAIEENKELYVYKLKDEYPLNKILEESGKGTVMEKGDKDGEVIFSSKKQKVFVADDDTIKDRFKDDEEYISSILEARNLQNLDVAMKQYEMFVETSEELVRRKQNVNSFYITLNSVIISMIIAAFAIPGSLTAFGLEIMLASIIIFLSSAVGGIVCVSWISLLQSYADLNSSKMKIISYIETQLAYNLYDTEWQLVSNKTGNRKYKSFSKKEKLIAKLFLGLYVVLILAGVILNFV